MVTLPVSAAIGFFLGFVFGVGCALAVMYSIYMGGYRAAVADSRMPVTPARLRKALEQLDYDNKNKPADPAS